MSADALDWGGDGRHLGVVLVFEQRLDSGIHCGGVEQRLVTLYIHEDVALDMGSHLGDALCTSAMVGPGHASFAAKALDRLDDPVVVGSHDHFMDRFCRFGPVVDALDHRLASQRNQRFAREPGRAVPGWDDNDDLSEPICGTFLQLVFGRPLRPQFVTGDIGSKPDATTAPSNTSECHTAGDDYSTDFVTNV